MSTEAAKKEASSSVVMKDKTLRSISSEMTIYITNQFNLQTIFLKKDQQSPLL